MARPLRSHQALYREDGILAALGMTPARNDWPRVARKVRTLPATFYAGHSYKRYMEGA